MASDPEIDRLRAELGLDDVRGIEISGLYGEAFSGLHVGNEVTVEIDGASAPYTVAEVETDGEFVHVTLKPGGVK